MFKVPVFFPLAALVFSINFLTMPRDFYPGDSHAIRMSSLQLIKNWRFGIEEEKAPTLGPLMKQEGQYFFHNPMSHQYFSKYGIFNTLLFAPPLIIEDLLNGVENFYDYTRPTASQALPFYTSSLVFVLNIYNILLGLVIAYYFFRLSGLYSSHLASRFIFLLSAFYATFLWNYLRAQSSEIFQVLFFAGFFDHFIRFRRALISDHGKDPSAWRHLFISSLFAGALVLTKQYFLLMFPVIAGGTTLASWPGNGRLAAFLKAFFHAHARRYLACLIAPMTVFALAALLANAWQFGSPFETGYGQWKIDGVPHDRISFAGIPQALHGFLLGIHSNIFIQFPLLLFSFFGVRLFVRSYAWELGFAYAIFLFFLFFFSSFFNWSGALCYGPRYLLFILPICSLPFLNVLTSLMQKIRTVPGAVAAVIVLGIMIYSTKLQCDVNRLPFLNFYELSLTFSKLHNSAINDYFSRRPFGLINADFLAYRMRNEAYQPLELLRNHPPPGQTNVVERYVEFLKTSDLHQSNYFFFRN